MEKNDIEQALNVLAQFYFVCSKCNAKWFDVLT